MRNHLIDKLGLLARTDGDIVVLTADLGFSVLEDFAREYPQRCYNVGICEQNMASLAAGLAMSGKEVYIYSIGNFPTMRCLEQIRNDICYHECNVKVIAVGGGFAYGKLGMSHHATEDFAVMRTLPHMRVFCPSGPYEAEESLLAAHMVKCPCYIRLERRGERDLVDPDASWSVGSLREIRAGGDVAVISTGTVLSESIKAAELLATEGIGLGVYNCVSLKPIDVLGVLRLASTHKAIVTVEEHNVSGGLGTAVSEVVCDAGVHTRLLRLGLKESFTSVVGDQTYLRSCFGVDATAISKGVKKLLDL